jgi:hypothetical protein
VLSRPLLESKVAPCPRSHAQRLAATALVRQRKSSRIRGSASYWYEAICCTANYASGPGGRGLYKKSGNPDEHWVCAPPGCMSPFPATRFSGGRLVHGRRGFDGRLGPAQAPEPDASCSVSGRRTTRIRHHVQVPRATRRDVVTRRLEDVVRQVRFSRSPCARTETRTAFAGKTGLLARTPAASI